MTESKRGPGQPPWIPTKEIIEQVESYAALGLTKEQIADCLGISYQTLNEKTKEYADFSEAIKRGQSKGIARMANLLTKSADGGSVPAQIFYLKARAKWSDLQTEEVEKAVKNELQEIRNSVQEWMQNQKK